MTNDEVKKELKRIQRSNNGVLSPSAVVESARPEESPLHSRFEWDDSVAAEQYRLEQARCIIRAVVTVVRNGDEEIKTRAFVSLSTYKGTEEPYIEMTKALRSRDLSEVLLDDAKRDAEAFSRKYSILKSLKPVLVSMREAKLID